MARPEALDPEETLGEPQVPLRSQRPRRGTEDPCGRDKPECIEPEASEHLQTSVHAPCGFVRPDHEELGRPRRAPEHVQALAQRAFVANLVVAIPVQEHLRPGGLPLEQHLHERGVPLQVALAVPVRYDEQRGTRDANSTEQREYAFDPILVHRRDVVEGDDEA